MRDTFIPAKTHLARIFWLSLISITVLMMDSSALAVEVIDGPEIVWDEDQVGATISWKTDQASGAVVRLGRAADQLREKHGGPVGTEHRIVVPELKKEGRYFYSIGTARRELKAGSFEGSATSTASEKPSVAQAVPEKREGFTLLPKGIFSREKKEPEPTKNTHSAKAIETVKAPDIMSAPPTAKTWASVATLEDHFVRHGRDFQSKNADHYAAQAWQFLQRAKAEGLPAKVDPEGTTRVWEPKTRAFAAYNRQMKTKTYFRPRRPDYFDDQPGTPIRLK